MFFDIFNLLCKENKTTPTAVMKELGYSTSNVTSWKKGNTPKHSILVDISNYFNVPINHLLGSAEDEFQNNEPPLSLEHKELLSLWDRLDELEQAEFKGELVGYIRAKGK